MPPRSLLALLLCATAGLPARAEKPALVVQAQPAAALIAEGKALAKLAGGTAPADFDDWLEDTFGEDGLKGLDLTKPLLAYSTLKGPAADCKFFAIVPVSKEADFLDLLERLDREATPVAGDATLYRIGDEDDEGVLHFRFHKGSAHFVLRGDQRGLQRDHRGRLRLHCGVACDLQQSPGFYLPVGELRDREALVREHGARCVFCVDRIALV